MPRHILFLRLAYQAGMCLLALVAVTLTAIDLTTEAAEWEVTADRVIYWIFVLDYVVRFSISRSKWLFVKEHPWDLLAIIPFDALFRLFRFASLGEILRLARYLDLFSYAMRFTTRIRRFFNTNGFKYICIAALVIILLGAVGIHLAEGMSLPNGIWWSFVTATTVGYGDTYPVTTSGKFLAVFLMLTGIGFVGTLTSTITSFFLSPHGGEALPYREEEIEAIKKKLDDLSSMTDEDIDTMAALLNALQMGFRTLAIQKRSGEVWTILGAVKTEFDKFEACLTQTQNRLDQASRELDKLVGTRTRAIRRKLKGVTELSESETQKVLDIGTDSEEE